MCETGQTRCIGMKHGLPTAVAVPTVIDHHHRRVTGGHCKFIIQIPLYIVQ